MGLNDPGPRGHEVMRPMANTIVTDEQVEAAAGILRPNGYDVPSETLRRALLAAVVDTLADWPPKAVTHAWCENHEQVVRWDHGAVGHGLAPEPSPDDDPAGPLMRDCPGPYSALRIDHGTAP